jgi:predicted DNA-binding transcriptional regulator AlpA
MSVSVPEKGLRAAEVAKLLSISLSMVWKLHATDKTFPKGAKLGRSRVFLQSDILRWLERRAHK